MRRKSSAKCKEDDNIGSSVGVDGWSAIEKTTTKSSDHVWNAIYYARVPLCDLGLFFTGRKYSCNPWILSEISAVKSFAQGMEALILDTLPFSSTNGVSSSNLLMN